MKLIDLVGRVFGRLRVVARAGSTDGTPARPLWHCRCSCGKKPIVLAADLSVTRHTGAAPWWLCPRTTIRAVRRPRPRSMGRRFRAGNGKA